MACVAGVTGANLKKRIEEIMIHRIADKLDFGRKLLATLGIAAVAGPFAIGLLHALQSRAQPSVASSPAFEVASVKVVKAPVAPHPVSLRINHGRLNVDAARLRQIIGLAYATQRVRVYGGPSWLDSGMYDIIAKAESTDASREQIRAMLQTLLADRFKLAVHRENKELPVYTLVIGKTGSKLREAKDDENYSVTPVGRGAIAFQKENMGSLANTLANILGSPVSDQTGLKGPYDFKLEWTDATRSQTPGNGNQPLPVDSGPDIFAAVQEQLGLKLEAKKGPVEVLIVDHAEKVPTEN